MGLLSDENNLQVDEKNNKNFWNQQSFGNNHYYKL